MIDFLKLAKSEQFFKDNSFKKIEVPWWVSKETCNITFSNTSDKFFIKGNKVLIGSGEQGFLHLMTKGMLLEGKYITTTPCFREDPNGVFYSKNFIKTEAIIVDNSSSEALEGILDLALTNFKQLLPSKHHSLLQVVKTDIGWDINLNNIEIGSYGIRTHHFLKWIYATVLAEPRFSKVENSI